MKKPKLIRKIHLWIGLSIGVVVFIVSITGALYVFKDEVQHIVRKEYMYHGESHIAAKKVLPLPFLVEKVRMQTREKYDLKWVSIPLDKSMSYLFYYYDEDSSAWNYFDELLIHKAVYVNPFTGKVTGVVDEKYDFFNIVKFIHWSLLFKASWGAYIVGIPVFLFLAMLVTGIILWYPKNKSGQKQRFWFRWKNIKTWKRKNYDIHSILGFYSSLFALIIAITGLAFAFLFVKKSIYFAFSGGKTYKNHAFHAPPKKHEGEKENKNLFDTVCAQVERIYPDAFSYSIGLTNNGRKGKKKRRDETTLPVYVRQLSYAYHIHHHLIFDKRSGKLLENQRHQDKDFGEKTVDANYDIHVGAILGIWGKIIAFIISLVCASLPITGFMVWWGRNKKLKKKPSPR